MTCRRFLCSQSLDLLITSLALYWLCHTFHKTLWPITYAMHFNSAISHIAASWALDIIYRAFFRHLALCRYDVLDYTSNIDKPLSRRTLLTSTCLRTVRQPGWPRTSAACQRTRCVWEDTVRDVSGLWTRRRTVDELGYCNTVAVNKSPLIYLYTVVFLSLIVHAVRLIEEIPNL